MLNDWQAASFSIAHISVSAGGGDNEFVDIQEIRRLNLRILVREAGSKAQLARLSGTDKAYLSQVDSDSKEQIGRPKGKKKNSARVYNIGTDLARRLERAKGMEKPRGWMDTYHPDPDTDQELDPTPILWIPLRSWGADRGSSMRDTERVPVDGRQVSERAFAMRVRGESMVNPAGRPSYPPGCVIVVDPDRSPKDGDRVVVQIPHVADAAFKVYTIDAGRVLLRSYASQIPALPWSDGMVVLGVVVKTIIDDV
jgi:hypothetical protein